MEPLTSLTQVIFVDDLLFKHEWFTLTVFRTPPDLLWSYANPPYLIPNTFLIEVRFKDAKNDGKAYLQIKYNQDSYSLEMVPFPIKCSWESQLIGEFMFSLSFHNRVNWIAHHIKSIETEGLILGRINESTI